MTDKRISRRELMGLAAAGLVSAPAASAKRAASSSRILHSKSLPGELRCEYLADPLGIDLPAPRLSWIVESKGRDWHQAAYQLLVASHRKILDSNQGDLWDSGKILSDRNSQVPYQGARLAARKECFWKVRVWDATDAVTAWSHTATWEMGLLSESDWRDSLWIGKETPAEPAPTPDPLPAPTPAPFLRREFLVEGEVQRARLYAAGVGYADLHLNGQRVGEESERDPAYTRFDRRILYVTHDVTALLTPNINAMGAVLGTGWYDVHDLATWVFEKATWRGQPRLRLLLAIDYADGRTVTIGSDTHWKTAYGPILHNGIYTGEIYDARLEKRGWDHAGFEDEKWEPVVTLPAPTAKLRARRCPPVAITRTLTPIGITQPHPGVFVVDMGQNFSGHTQLHVRGMAGTTVTLRYSEKIGKEGGIDRSNIDYFMTKTSPPQPFQSDSYICSGVGLEKWEQRFSYSGFRYVEVTGFPGEPTIANFHGRFAHTDLETAGEFSCSNELLNKIQHATRWSYLSNAQSIPTDCPQREKNGWTGDAHLAAEMGLMNFRSATFYTKWLEDLADDQEADGKLSMIVPTGGWGRGACNPAWDSAYPIIAWDLYRYLGDLKILDQHYASLRRYVDYLAAHTEQGVVPFDSLGDWVPWSTQTPSQLTSTAYLFLDARIVAQAAALLHKDDDAAKYADLAETTRKAFQTKWFDPAANSYANGSQTALSTPLFFGITPEENRAAVFANLVANVEKQGHIDTGILGAKHLLRVLSEGGRTDLAYKLVARTEQPGWGWWIKQGATTLWESWTGTDSRNHIMFGDVSNWFIQWIAGIGLDPDSPGFRHVFIRPQPVEDLTWARAYHESPQGRIESAWHKESAGSKDSALHKEAALREVKEHFHLELTIPANTTATVRIPTHSVENPMENITENGKAVAKSSGVRLLRTEADSIYFTVGSGHYKFRA